MIAPNPTPRPSTIVISDWLANCSVGQWTPFEAATALKATLAKEGYTIVAESDLAKARDVIRPFAEYAASDVFRIVHENAPDNLYVMRNSDSYNITKITVGDFRAAHAFQGEK